MLSFRSAKDGPLDGNFTPYQFTFSANTIFALSGMFNVILFFATRPRLIIESEQLHLEHGSDSSGVGSSEFGHLPDCQYPRLSPDLEKFAQSDFSPRMSTESNRLHASSFIVNTLPSRRTGSGNPGHLSLERGGYQWSRGFERYPYSSTFSGAIPPNKMDSPIYALNFTTTSSSTKSPYSATTAAPPRTTATATYARPAATNVTSIPLFAPTTSAASSKFPRPHIYRSCPSSYARPPVKTLGRVQ